MKKILLLTYLFLCVTTSFAQNRSKLSGIVTNGSKPIAGANVLLSGNKARATDTDGKFEFSNLASGKFTLSISAVGFQSYHQDVIVQQGRDNELKIELKEDNLGLNEVVVSATRYGVSRKEAPVIVNVLSPKIFNATQSVVMSETLNFQPGVRVETNCQNCGFTQVRLNGLEGGYSQILINSRPVFSALTSVYGLEQIPASMIERIEVVRSGGSALFGSNAIAGTINIITKDPVENSWQIANNISAVKGWRLDHTLNFNGSLVNDDLQSGVTFYGMVRNRSPFDANGDGFTEMTKLENNTFGGKAFFRTNERGKITFDFSAIKEFRRGGDRLSLAPHFTDITEQLDHNTVVGGLTYDVYSKDMSNKFSAYVSAQLGKRKSYYGGLGGGREIVDSVSAANAYGNTYDLALVGGAQFTRHFISGDVLTLGSEFQGNKVNDEIIGYQRRIDQRTSNVGAYAQYEWKPSQKFTALIGARYDVVDVNGTYQVGETQRSSKITPGVISPRLTLLYNLSEDLQFRGGYARGFRAPQAFNEDMHVSSVGGEPSFVIISDQLETEFSNAYTASLNYSRTFSGTQVNFLLEGFYTDLKNPFTTVNTGTTLLNGSILEEVRNGSGAYVAGSNIELSVAPSSSFSIQAGGTVQRSRYRKPQILFEPEPASADPTVSVSKFMRTPNAYGYLNTNWKLNAGYGIDLSGVYTGTMVAPHVTSASGYPKLIKTPSFFELNIRLSKQVKLSDRFNMELITGLQNIFNSYQKDFDTGPTRDSDYIYGPSRPRTVYVGLKFGKFTP